MAQRPPLPPHLQDDSDPLGGCKGLCQALVITAIVIVTGMIVYLWWTYLR